MGKPLTAKPTEIDLVHTFLSDNRDELIPRCKAKVAQRPNGAATPKQLTNRVPLFLGQLTDTLRAEGDGDAAEGQRISGPSGSDAHGWSQIGAARMFKPLTQGGVDGTGWGVGPSIARRTIEADGGSLTVRDVPGTGCVFTLAMPRCAT